MRHETDLDSQMEEHREPERQSWSGWLSVVSVHPLFKHCDFYVGLAMKKFSMAKQNKEK